MGNFDLTERQTFKKNNFEEIFNSVLVRVNEKRYLPWRFINAREIESDQEFKHKYKINFFTGNKSERETKKFIYQEESGNREICIRCGESLNFYPYEEHYELCENCLDAISKRKIIPWRFANEERSTNFW